MRKSVIFLLFCIGLGVLSGCRTYEGTKFTPLEARLQSGSGGAQVMVLVNSSGQTLHNVHFRAYMWGANQMMNSQQPYMLSSESNLPQRGPAITYTFQGSADKLAPGQVIHFTKRGMGSETGILGPVTKVQIVGSSDEGKFRETWLMRDNGQLELVGVPES